MPTKADTYRQMADHATANLTAQVIDWSKFLLTAGQFHKYNFLDQVMIYTQRPTATACAEFDLWSRRMGRRIRRGSKGIALLRYRDGRVFLRYVFDVADTERRENGRDPMLWQYRDEYEPAVTARLAECFKVPGNDGLDKQFITLAVRFTDEHWHDFKDDIMLSVHDSQLDDLDEDNVALRFRNAATVSLAFLLLGRCGFDLDEYFTPEDFACIRDFNTRDTVLALGNAVSESAGVILRQVEYAIKRQLCAPPKKPIPESTPAAGTEKSAAGPVSVPESEAPPIAVSEPPQEVPERQEASQTEAPVLDPLQAQQGQSASPTPKVMPEDPTADAEKPAAILVSTPESEAPPIVPSEPPQEAPEQLSILGRPQMEMLLPEPVNAGQELSTKPAPAAANFRITDDDPGSFGPKGRFCLNVEAIRTLKAIESEKRGPVGAEQEVMSRYTGWGAIPEAFDPGKPEWAEEYAELKALLTEEEYASARASTLNAHFTTPVVIRSIYAVLGSMGFQSGNILEPSCGVGNFFGCLPESMAASRLYGVELDGISGRIAKQLYPKANITVAAFETTSRNDFYDAAVGNVPFGDYGVSDPSYDKYHFSIHNYFLCKTLDQLRPGGIMAVVTSRYTMDSKDSAARKYLAERADLLGAIRLPKVVSRICLYVPARY